MNKLNVRESEDAARLQAAGFGPGSGLNGPVGESDGKAPAAVAEVRPPEPPMHQSICKGRDEYRVAPGHLLLTCTILAARIELNAGERGCCHGEAVMETMRVQQEGGCPLGKF